MLMHMKSRSVVRIENNYFFTIVTLDLRERRAKMWTVLQDWRLLNLFSVCVGCRASQLGDVTHSRHTFNNYIWFACYFWL